MAEVVRRAREMVDLLEDSHVDAATELFSARIRGYIEQGWSLDAFLQQRWHPDLDELAGPHRRITSEAQVSPTAVRFEIRGEYGTAVVTIPFDDDGGIGGLGIAKRAFEGIGTVVIACPPDRVDEVAAFYAVILGNDRWRIPRLHFGEGHAYRAPGWGDVDAPQQIHLDIAVRDLAATEEMVVRMGARLLQGGGDERTYADPIGHALCLYQASVEVDDAMGVLDRIIIDCPEPDVLASFYQALLAMPLRVQDTSDRVVIGRDDARPQLALQRVSPYVAPRWPDPAFPAQMHFDLKFDDREAAAALAVSLGASLLPPQGGSCPVYADPAGHPFCLCMHGQ
jgi:hypothetical protein